MSANNAPNNRLSNSSSCLSLDELIAYSEGNLSTIEREKLDRHAAHCSLCSDAIDGVITFSDKENIRPIIKAIQNEIHHRAVLHASKKQNWKIYYAAAAILILAVSLSLFLLQQKSTTENLFSQYFKPYPNTIPLVRGEDAHDKFKMAMSEYEFENFARANRILEEILRTDPDQPIAHFYAGITALCLNRTDDAITHLQQVIKNDNNEFIEHAQWYLGLAFLKNGDVEQAKSIFNSIAKNDLYKFQSIEILKDLN